MLETLIDNPAQWFSATGPEADVVVSCHGALQRNLSEFPFPNAATHDDKRAIQERLANLFERRGLLGAGNYWPLESLDAMEVRLLRERNLIGEEMTEAEGPRGVFVSDDQSLSVVVNGANHVAIQVAESGLQPREVWLRLNEVDSALQAYLDFAFDQRLGYLTSNLDSLGTGLSLSALLHLPGLRLSNLIGAVIDDVGESWHQLSPVSGELANVRGDLYTVENRSTLGISEEELVYNLRHTVNGVVERERRARADIRHDGECVLKDRIGRALGIAREACLLEDDEAVDLLSSLRLGVSTGLLGGYTLEQLNELLITSQSAHLELREGHRQGDLALSMERADLFRARFS